MGGVVSHPELAANHLGNPLPGPALSHKAPGGRTSAEQLRNSLVLLGGQPGEPTGPRVVAECGLASFPSALEPLAHRASSNAERFGDARLLPTLPGEFPGANTPAFPPGDRLGSLRLAHGRVLPDLTSF